MNLSVGKILLLYAGFAFINLVTIVIAIAYGFAKAENLKIDLNQKLKVAVREAAAKSSDLVVDEELLADLRVVKARLRPYAHALNLCRAEDSRGDHD